MRNIRIKRVYEPTAADDGKRILVDRLWPRGISKEAAKIDEWAKDASPSTALRKEFHGHPDRWTEFCAAYALELAQEPAHSAASALRDAAHNGVVTLLYAAKDEERNNAAALLDWLKSR